MTDDLRDETLVICTETSIGNLIDQITWGLTDESIVQLIIALDEEMADWAATEKLYRHFKKQHKILKQEGK